MPLRPSAAPPTTSAPATTVANGTLDPVTIPPSVGYRDLAALRAQLAGNGQVNPPEAAEALKEEMFQPQTRETEAGGAEALVASPWEAESSSAQDAPAAKRKRRTKAEMEAEKSLPPAAAVSGGTTEPEPSALILELRRIADAMEKIACRGN